MVGLLYTFELLSDGPDIRMSVIHDIESIEIQTELANHKNRGIRHPLEN